MLKPLRNALLVGAATIAFMAATPSFADDRWTGAYFGAGVSIGKFDGTLSGFGSDFLNPDTIVIDDSVTLREGAVGVTAEIGYDRQLSNGLVVGASLEGTLNLNDISASANFEDKTQVGSPELDYFSEVDATVAAVGRIGHEFNDSSLVYLLGGGTLVSYTLGGSYDVSGSEAFSWEDRGLSLAPTVGFGFEGFVSENKTFRLEYRATYVDITSGHSDALQQGETTLDGFLQAVTGKFVYRFPHQ